MLPLLMAVIAGPEERALVLRLQRRDPQALAELYDRYGRMAYSLVLRVVRDGAIAEDLVQETFLRVWNRVHSIDSEKGSLGPWLLAIARNRAIDYLRSSAGRERKAVRLANPAPVSTKKNARHRIRNRFRAFSPETMPHFAENNQMP